MKLLIEPSRKDISFFSSCDGVILPLENYAVESHVFFSFDEIKEICQSASCEVFVKVNKNFMNEDIPMLEDVLKKLDSLPIQGIFFYDLAVLQIKKNLSLKLDLVWNQTHMVNNSYTCDYYYSKGVKYAFLGKEITLEEILEIIKKSSITSMVEVVGLPSVAFSKRKLVTHYFQDMKKEGDSSLVIHEKVSNQDYSLEENQDGTNFFLNTVVNGTSIIADLYQGGCSYIVFLEYGLEDCFQELVVDTMDYIRGRCLDSSYVSKYEKLGNYTNFFFKKTVYRVKK